MDNPTPGIGKLITRDHAIQNALATTLFPPLFLLINYFMKINFNSILFYIIAALPAVGFAWLIIRYMNIMSAFREGITIKGRVVKTETRVTHSRKGGRKTRHYATISYTVSGENYEQRIQLAHAPGDYGLDDGNMVDLILREEKPKTVFIKHIYLD